MAEALDENSLNTDLTFESGDENVCIAKNLICLINWPKIEIKLKILTHSTRNYKIIRKNNLQQKWLCRTHHNCSSRLQFSLQSTE